MNSGVPSQHQTLAHRSVFQQYEPPIGDSLAVKRRFPRKAGRRTFRVGLILLGSLSTLIFASSALGATSVGLGSRELLGAGRLDDHEHGPDDDVRRSRSRSLLLGDRRSDGTGRRTHRWGRPQSKLIILATMSFDLTILVY
jgi:hypothetical protein